MMEMNRFFHVTTVIRWTKKIKKYRYSINKERREITFINKFYITHSPTKKVKMNFYNNEGTINLHSHVEA